MRETLGLNKTPHFTTLQKAERRLLTDPLIRKYLTQTVEAFYEKQWPSIDAGHTAHNTAHNIELAAADSTGFVLDRASRYFITRRSRAPNLYQTTQYRRFAKLAIVIDCDTLLILATHRGMGPLPDVDQLKPLLQNMCTNVVPQQLVADGGYDSQYNHRLLRETYNIESIIPATLGRPTDKLPTDRWRYLMATAFDEETYAQRWQVETVMFMLKHHQGAALTAHTYQTRRREMGLMAVTHNILILRPIKLFYKALPTPFFHAMRSMRSRRCRRMPSCPRSSDMPSDRAASLANTFFGCDGLEKSISASTPSSSAVIWAQSAHRA